MHDIIQRHYTELQKICSKYNVDVYEAIGRNRKREFKRPRTEVACYLKHKYNYTYKRLGEVFDGRDYSAMIHLINKCKPKKQYNLRTETIK